MRELDAAQAMLAKAIQKALESNAKRITGLHLVVGEISTYAADSVESYWNDISRGTIAEGAELFIRPVQAEVQCMNCFTKYHPNEGGILCPNCKSVGAKILTGEEFYVEAVDIE